MPLAPWLYNARLVLRLFARGERVWLVIQSDGTWSVL
jgi:hypothetical protein